MASALSGRERLTYPLAAFLVLGIAIAAWQIADWPQDGRILSFSVLSGALFGIVLQRSRFCFFCMARDYLDERDARGLLGLLAALAVGTLGYHVLFSAFLPVPAEPRLPPGAHIGPVSWVLALGALSFGVGMSVSGSCISAHMYRLGEGAIASILALLGAMAGFGLGFASWNFFYLAAVQEAAIVWLPHHVGYGGAIMVQLLALGLLASWLMSRHRNQGDASASAMGWRSVLQTRWPAWLGGILVAFIGVLAYFRSAPLGVTAELGSLARTAANSWNLLPDRLEGLDTFAGCATAVKEAVFSRNGLFVLALIAGSWASALAANEFKPRWPGWRDGARHFFGGVLMGWGGMIALGCTVGTLLSGVMAGAVSGWVFGLFCMLGLWGGWRLRQYVGGRRSATA